MITVIWHGHSFIQIRYNNLNILVDPYSSNQDFDIMNLGKITHIILTHGHGDHIGLTKNIAKFFSSQIIGVAELTNYFKTQQGIENIHGMNIGGEYNFGDFSIKLVNAIHSGGIGNGGTGYCTSASGAIIRIGDKNIYHAGDTALTYDMKLLGEYDKIDLAFLPIGNNYTMGVKDAIIATSFIKPKIVVPIHFNTFDLINADAQEFAKQVMMNNYATPKILDIGQYIVLQ